MNLIQGRRCGREVYIRTESVVVLEPHPDHLDSRTRIHCIDGKDYVLDLPIEEVLKQIPEGKE